MNSNSRLLKLHQINEQTITWNLNGLAPTTTMRRVNGDNVWMPPPGNTVLQENIWNSYLGKKLLKVTWKINNIRVFLNTAMQKGTGNATVTSQEARDWVLWSFKQKNLRQDTSPPNTAEERCQRTVVKGPHSKIWGKVPVNSARMNANALTYSDMLTQFNVANGLPDYLSKYNGNQIGPAATPTHDSQSTSGMWIMPDDPYPGSFFTSFGGENLCDVSVTFDYHMYTTWSLRDQLST